jgi:hypothetical protein
MFWLVSNHSLCSSLALENIFFFKSVVKKFFRAFDIKRYRWYFGINTRLPCDTAYSDTNPDPTFLFDTAPEPDLNPDPNGKKFKNSVRGRICKEFQEICIRKTLFYTVLGRILIQDVNFGSGSCKMMQIQPDPGPQHCGYFCIKADARRSSVHPYSSSLLQKQKPPVLLLRQNNSPYSY